MKWVTVSFKIILLAAPILLLACAQADANPVPPVAPNVETADVPTPGSDSTVVTVRPATPTPTPFPPPTPTPSPLRPEELLQRINSVMASAKSFHLKGESAVSETGESGAGPFTARFEGDIEPHGDSRMVITINSAGSPLADGYSYKIREVDEILYIQDTIAGSWAVKQEDGGILDQETFQAALTGNLDLANMRVEEILSEDWRPVYRLTGSAPADPEVDQVVLLVDPEDLLILELQLDGQALTSELAERTSKPFRLRVRISDFNEPLEIVAPSLKSPPVASTPIESTPMPAPLSDTLVGPELEALQQSFERMQDVESFRATIEVTMEADGEVLTGNIDMEQGQDGSIRIEMVMDLDGQMSPISMEMIMAPPDFYMKADGEGWFKFSGDYWQDFAGGPMPLTEANSELFMSPLPLEEIPWQAFSVRSLGDEQVNGVVAEHLIIEIDLQDYWEQLSEEWKEQFTSSFMSSPGQADYVVEEMLQLVEIKDIHVWMDSQGYLRKAIFAMEVEAPTSLDITVVKLEMEMNLFDYGEEIIIELPEEYEDFLSLFESYQ